MYNLRYHLASLVAVFLALAVGLLLGTVVAERGMLTDQSTAIVRDLQQRFDEINATNDDLRTRLEQDRAFATDVEPLLTGGLLAGRSVVLVTTPGRTDGADEAAVLIERAGGVVSRMTVKIPGAGLGAQVPDGLADALAARGEEPAPAGDERIAQVAALMAAEWRAGGPTPVGDLLAEAGLVEMRRTEATPTIDAVLVMSAQGSACDSFSGALAEAMSEAGGVGAAAQVTPEAGPAAAECAARGLSAVDHLSTPQGRFSLVWLLAGRAQGFFGSGETAERYYPRVDAR